MSFKLVCDHLKKLTPDELEKLKLILSGVSNCTQCNVEINYKGVCEMCYTELKLNDLD